MYILSRVLGDDIMTDVLCNNMFRSEFAALHPEWSRFCLQRDDKQSLWSTNQPTDQQNNQAR